MQYNNTDIAIIGAGTSGSFIAYQLERAGMDCIVFEKSRGQGGRCSRRQLDNTINLDIGSPDFFVDRSNNQDLTKHIDTWVKKGSLQSWSYQASNFHSIDQCETVTSLCGAPSMNNWHKSLTERVRVQSHCQISSLTQQGQYWQLNDEKGHRVGRAKKVILTCPAKQTIDLLKTSHRILDDIPLSPNHTSQFICAIGYSEPSHIPADLYRSGHVILDTAIRENNKPMRRLPPTLKEVWLLHSTADWAHHHASLSHEHASILLCEAFNQHFRDHLNTSTKPHILTSHHWLLARHPIQNNTTAPFIWDASLQIGCCGDWLSTGDISGALNSALSLFQHIASTKRGA
jgi:renalase